MIDEAERAVRVVAAELKDLPIYIVGSHHLTGTEELSEAWGAIAHPELDLIVKPFVQWRGRGFCTVFSPANIEAKGPDVLTALVGTVIHELGHFFADDHLGRLDAPGACASKFLLQYVRAGFGNGVKAVETEKRRAREDYLASHGLRFLRVLGHLKARLEKRCGIIISLQELYSYPRPSSMQQLCFYLSALADEIAACDGLTFADILERPVPPRLLELWENDTNPPAPSAGKEQEEDSNMNILDYLRDLKDSVAALVRDDKVTYRGLVIKVAGGATVAPKELRQVLLHVGATMDQFEADAKLVAHRRDLRKKVDAFDKVRVEARRAEITAYCEGNDRDLDVAIGQARAKHEARRVPMDMEWRELERVERDALAAQAELRGHPVPELAQRDNDLAQRQSAATARRCAAQQLLITLPNCDPSKQEFAEGDEKERIKREYAEKAANAKRDIESADAEIAELQRERDAVAELMLAVE